MQVLSIILFAIVTGLLIGVASILPRRSVLSSFELERREGQGNGSAADERRREILIDDILSLRRVVEAMMVILVVAFGLLGFGIVIGIIVSFAVALLYPRIAASEIIHTWAMRFYEQSEPSLLNFVEHHGRILHSIRSVSRQRSDTPLSSREELEHLVDSSGGLLTTDEKKLIRSSLHFKEKTVGEIMTPRGVVATIPKDELIGPLTLDELHRTGFSRFPVIDEDIDHVIGVLHIKELLTVGHKDSETAAKAMEKKVYYINQNQTLEHALAAFIKTRHHLFIVVNGYRETAGILTLEDVIEALLGREIVDEFDLHDDLRVVAERNATHNNNPPHATNV
jgi:CBS domain containing-hemolysin-like protein